jgi:hypothetical protein
MMFGTLAFHPFLPVGCAQINCCAADSLGSLLEEIPAAIGEPALQFRCQRFEKIHSKSLPLVSERVCA